TAALPMLGAAYQAQIGSARVRLRSAYGKAVRSTTLHDREQQSGIDAGVDLSTGMFVLQLTRFDQAATSAVGEIDNEGWEAQLSAQRGRFSLTGGVAFVDSRVRRVADGYTGELRAGDRLPSVPSRMLSLDASWSAADWSASLGVSRAFDWIGYDGVLLAAESGRVTGSQLASSWQRQNGATHARATFTRRFDDGLMLLLSGDNLLNRQTGGPDNLTIVPGRTISIGVRAAF
ncbi:MAG: TonB-dependent receptor domain-containing protein, partial [Gemmatimonadota bacterium]